jgi:hypothetical protein
MKNKYALLLILFSMAAWSGCKDDECFDERNPLCENFNPCLVKYPEKMDIEMLITDPRDLNIYIPTFDTVFVINANLYFYTNFEYDSVSWQVGSDPTIWNTKSLPLRFEKEALNSTVTVTAKCFRPIDNDCFGAMDDGIDILTRTITFRAHEDSPLHGIWRGTNDGEKDSFDVEIQRLYYEGTIGNDTFYDGTRLSGIPKGTQTFIGRPNTKIRWFSFIYTLGGIDPNNLISRTVEGRIQENGNIKISWKLYDDDRLRTFTGKKLK